MGSSKRTLILYKYLSAKKSRQDVFVTSLIFNTIDTFSTGIQRFRLNRSIKQCQVGFFILFRISLLRMIFLILVRQSIVLIFFTIFDDIIFRDERLLPTLTSFYNQGTLVIIKSYINFDYSGEDLKR